MLIITSSVFATGQKKTTKKAAPKAAAVSYKQVQGIFDKNCLNCHRGPRPKAMLNLESYAGVMKGNDDGSVVTPGKPDKSLLYKLVSWTGRKNMPPAQAMAKADIATVEAWIKAGAKNK